MQTKSFLQVPCCIRHYSIIKLTFKLFSLWSYEFIRDELNSILSNPNTLLK